MGIHVVDVESGQTLYTKNTNARFNPASNAKLVTSATALDLFGPQRTFSTTLSASSKDIKGDTLDGPLYMRGTGEGFLLYEDVLDWAASLRAQGLTTITGDIIVADGPFEGGAYLPPAYDQKDEDASYRSPVGSVSINFNAVDVIVTPGKLGAPATVKVHPPNEHVEIVNTAKTVAGSGRRISASSITVGDAEGTKIAVRGAIGAGARAWSTRKRIDNPPLFAASVMKGALSSLGVTVKGEAKKGETPVGVKTLVSHNSEPLIYVLMAMNKWSNNFMAEQVFRVLGTSGKAGDAQGTWAGARKVVTDFLASVTELTEETAVKNGSGLYTGNWYTPKQIADLLLHMHRHRWAPEFKSTLAINGVDGTLSRRLTDDDLTGRLRAKTGTLNQVIALSGYATTVGGREVVMVILFNDPPVRAWRLRPQQDDIARAILRWEG